MKRRDFVRFLGGAAVARPLVAHAQQPERMKRIGVFTILSADDPVGQARHPVFLQGLRELGWTVGHNPRIDYLLGPGDGHRNRRYSGPLVPLSPEVLLAT